MPGIISHPVPFEVSIRLRDQRYEEIIRSVEERHPRERNDADILRQIVMNEKREE
jgi:hypothetical protein